MEPSTEVPDNQNPIGNPADPRQSLAFVTTRAPDFSSGQLIRLSLSENNVVTGQYMATGSDIDVDTDGSHVYQIGRFSIDSITRYDPLDTSLFDYQLSVNDEDTLSANPQDMAFVDESKGYLTRRGSEKLWIIDPSPENSPVTVEDFRIGELDLGAYDIDLPNMTDAIIVDDKLFVLLELLNELPDGNQIPDKPGFIAVFDTRTDQEINTGQSGNNLDGIRLLTANPTALQYNESTGQIYVIGRGNFFENETITDDFYSGGVEVIDPTTYQHSLLVDDGTAEENNGYFLDGVVVNDSLGYLITADYDPEIFSVVNTQLRTFNPQTGDVSEPIADLITASENLTLLAIGPDEHLWIGIDSSTPGFARINLQTGELDSNRVATSLIPSGISFLSTEQ
jgi:DNA-binding beta-propeller fold protein YncE